MRVHVGPPAADFPSVPVGKPQRAQQILRPSLKTQVWGKKVTHQASGFQETGGKMSPLGLCYGRHGLLCPQHYTQWRIPRKEERGLVDGWQEIENDQHSLEEFHYRELWKCFNSKDWLRKTKSSQKTILCTLYVLSTLGVEWLFWWFSYTARRCLVDQMPLLGKQAEHKLETER